jgi:predicted nuclease of predicted toxin-antitoxin system
MLLFDENISARAAAILGKDFPGSRHVKDFSLLESSDSDLWHTAKSEGLTILSKDDDFLQRALLLGHPPKVIILKIGNCSTRDLITFLRDRLEAIHSFISDSPESLLMLKK